MSDKKTSASATSATKKASAASKTSTTTTPAPPKAEVCYKYSLNWFYSIYKQKVDLTKKPTAAATAPATSSTTTPAQTKPKATTPSAKSTSSLAKTSTKVTKKTTTTPKGGKAGAKKKNKAIKYFIDCAHPVEDGIFDLNAFVRIQYFYQFYIELCFFFFIGTIFTWKNED